MSLVDLKKPQLHSIDSSGFQNLVIDGTKLIVSTDIVSQDVSFADIKSTSDTHTTQLQYLDVISHKISDMRLIPSRRVETMQGGDACGLKCDHVVLCSF